MEREQASRANAPLVTFALFAYNQKNFIREAIEGAFSQSYQPLEIILSDDCSTDGTFDVMQQMAACYDGPHRIRVNQNSSNLGLARHINRLIDLSRGEIISWAAGDDIAFPERTAILVDSILSDDCCVGAHSSVIEIDGNGNFIRHRRCQPQSAINLDVVVHRGESVVTQSHAFRAEVFRKFGHFQEGLTQEGIAMAFRECASGTVNFVAEPLTKYRVGVGVSTYSGKDIRKLKYDEPRKYTNWYLTAFRQMLIDCQSIRNVASDVHINTIKKKILFYENLAEVNSGTSFMVPLFRNFLLFPRNTQTMRAVVRRIVPENVYRLRIRG